MQILIINGPNLNNIGVREPNLYGNISFTSFLDKLRQEFPEIDIDYSQTQYESKIVEIMHNANNKYDGIVLNAGAFSHTSVAIRDAVAAIDLSVVMVHISNVYSREQFRNKNIIAQECKGIITGFGLNSYKLAILSFIDN